MLNEIFCDYKTFLILFFVLGANLKRHFGTIFFPFKTLFGMESLAFLLFKYISRWKTFKQSKNLVKDKKLRCATHSQKSSIKCCSENKRQSHLNIYVPLYFNLIDFDVMYLCCFKHCAMAQRKGGSLKQCKSPPLNTLVIRIGFTILNFGFDYAIY